jgi:hypothetical protein
MYMADLYFTENWITDVQAHTLIHLAQIFFKEYTDCSLFSSHNVLQIHNFEMKHGKTMPD